MSGTHHRTRAFGTAGIPIEANTFEPQESDSGWTVVVCPGYGSIKNLMTTWAVALAGQGHRVHVVGYRGYGDKLDQTGRIFPSEHIDDVRGIVRWSKSEEDSKRRVAVLGVSYGGAIAIAAGGKEPSVDAVISIVGYGSGARHVRATRRYHEWLELLDQVAADRNERSRTGVSQSVTLDEIFSRDANGVEWRRRVEAEHPTMRFTLTMESVDQLLEFRPEQALPYESGTPILILHAERDRMIPLSEAFELFDRAGDPKHLVVIPEIDHHDIHQGVGFDRSIAEVESFLSDLPAQSTHRPQH